MLRVGTLEAGPGEHVFGFLDVGCTRSGLRPAIPVHLFAGVEPGPTLLVQGALHGTEIVGSIAILNMVNKLDPSRLRGHVIAVPVLNRIGFELNARISPLDHKDIGRLFPGNPMGSVSEQIAYVYFEEVIRQANVMIDFHQGGLASYERYVLFSAEKSPAQPSALELKRRRLVVAFGLPAVAFFPPGTFKENQSEAIEQAGVIQFTPELGGGTGWYENGLDDVYVGERGIWNTLKAMGMLEGEFESDGPLCTVFNAGIVFWKPAIGGLFLRQKGMGEVVRAGEIYGIMVDPFTGRTLAQMPSPQEATVIPGGREWPSVGDTSVGIMGVVERVEDRRTMNLYVSFDE